MCGRFTLRASASVIAEQFSLFEVPAFVARFNIAPTQPVPVIRRQADALPSPRRELSWLRWGLIPGWAKDPAIGARLINARAETAAEKPAFRAAMRRRRCLVVADGFYEWQPSGRTKQPHFIRLRDDRPFAFAGVWETWEGADHSLLETCAILTTGPNELIRPIHDRMPAILSPADYASWLDPAIEDPSQLRPLLTPYPSDAMQAHPVGDFVNSPTHDSSQCIERMLQKGIIPRFPGWE
jgi:putative SOS response-associated peptidase YedK